MTPETSQTPASEPQRLTTRHCPECGTLIPSNLKGRDREFCKEACKQVFRNRLAVRGKAIAALAQAWRIDRGSGDVAKQCFAELTSILDLFNSEDRDAGRPRPTEYARRLLQQGRYIDRMQRR
jgi:endogenous inhibitor of DNA gyrase (YacG/DUF329 family)